MHTVLNMLGGHPLIGVLAALLAGTAFFAWDYLRMTGATRRSAHLTLVRRVAVAAAIVSAVLIMSRFLAVEIL